MLFNAQIRVGKINQRFTVKIIFPYCTNSPGHNIPPCCHQKSFLFCSTHVGLCRDVSLSRIYLYARYKTVFLNTSIINSSISNTHFVGKRRGETRSCYFLLFLRETIELYKSLPFSPMLCTCYYIRIIALSRDC